MTDLRAAILARCDYLEQVAEAAGGLPWRWETVEHTGGIRADTPVAPDVVGEEYLADGDPVSLRGPTGSGGSERFPDLPFFAIRHVEEMRSTVALFLATIHPAIVLDLVAGAREICGVHILKITHPLPNYDLDSCAEDYDEWPCRTLRAAARMIGVKVDA